MQVWYKRFIPIFLFILVLLPFSLAVPPFSEDVSGVFTEGLIIDYPTFNYHKEYNIFELNIHAYNISTGFEVTNESTSCEGHLYNSTGEELYHIPHAPTNNGHNSEFVFRMNDSSIIKLGYYGWSIHCNTSYLGGYASGNFIITETGIKDEVIVQDSEDELFLYFIFAIAIILLLISFYKDDHNLATISGMLLFVLGGYILSTGFSTLSNTLSVALGVVLVGVGFYIIIRSNIENI